MSQPKFGSRDRKIVVRTVEQHLDVSLSRVGRRPKYLRDASGRRYCFFGGYQDWHGLPDEVVEEERHRGDSVLVYARRRAESIEVYTAPLKPLIEAHAELSVSREGLFMFNVDGAGERLRVRQVPQVVLTRLATVDVHPSKVDRAGTSEPSRGPSSAGSTRSIGRRRRSGHVSERPLLSPPALARVFDRVSDEALDQMIEALVALRVVRQNSGHG